MAAEAAAIEAEAAPVLPCNGVVERTISAPLEKLWTVASDFLRFPNLLTIEAMEGENGVAGCTRKVSNLPGRTDTHSQQWAKQKLVETNPHEHLFSYEFLKNNTGVDPGYYSTFQVCRHSRKVGRLWCDGRPSSALPKLCSDRFVPFILRGTNLYVEELEKLAAT